MEKHWFGTGNYNATGTNGAAAGEYSYWFQGSDGVRSANHVTTAQGLPGSGDTMYWDGGAATLTASLTWDNVAIAAGQTVTLHGYGESLTMHANCVIGAGSSLSCNLGGGLILAATWLGDVRFSADSPQLATGWTAPDNANVHITSTSNSILLYAPVGTGRFGDMTLVPFSTSGGVDLSRIGAITVTGAFTTTLGASHTLALPSGNWLTLKGSNASAFGVKAAAIAGGGLLVI